MLGVNLSKPKHNAERIAFFSALLAGFLAHGFAFTNILNNYDSIFERNNPAGLGTGIYSGRWALQLMKEFLRWCSLDYNIPMLNGIIFILLIAVSSSIVVAVFQLSDNKTAAYIGMLFSVFPAVTSAMFFPYTVVPYGISILFSVLAVWALRAPRKRYLLAIFLIAWSMGIYQAYITITISLFVLLLLQEAIRGDSDFFILFKKGISYCIVLILGTLLYFFLLNLFLDVYHAKLNDYQGISSMGNITLEQIPGLLMRTLKSFFLFPFTNYCSLSHTPLLTMAYVGLGIAAVVIILAALIKNVHRSDMVLMTALLCFAFPIAVNFIVFLCPTGNIYTIMVYSFVLVPCAPLILFDGAFSKETCSHTVWHRILSKALAMLVCLIIFLNTYYAHVNYTALHYTNRQINNYVTSVITQVRMTPGFTADKKWVLIGDLQDPLFASDWDAGILYGGNMVPENFLSAYSSRNWFTHYAGYHYIEASSEELERISQQETVKNMPCWPDEGSVQVVGDYVVLKFDDNLG